MAFEIAHRGDPFFYCENTLESFQSAIRKGAKWLETDVCLTKDEQIICWHDSEPSSTISVARELGLEDLPWKPRFGNRLPIDLVRSDEMKDWGYVNEDKYEFNIPKLEELLSMADVSGIFLDIKISEDRLRVRPYLAMYFMKRLRKIVKETGYTGEIIIMSTSEYVLKGLRSESRTEDSFKYAYDKELPLGIILRVTEDLSVVRQAMQIGSWVDYACVGLAKAGQLRPWHTYTRIIKYDAKAKWRKLGEGHMKLISWTINDKRNKELLSKLGVDGIMTDVL